MVSKGDQALKATLFFEEYLAKKQPHRVALQC